MSKKVKFLIFLLVGVGQTAVAHMFRMHGDLAHMQYTHWFEYVVEAVFYTVWWAGLYWFFFCSNPPGEAERSRRYEEERLHKQRRKIK